ncbi:Crp/Fnr family transcriptional regulator [Kaarinaea lacus]
MHKEHASFGFLQKLSQEEQRLLESIGSCLSFKKKDYIFQANRTNNTIYILTEGRVKLSRLSSLGQECIQWFCFPGEIFGLSENTYDHDSGLYAQALISSSVLAIPKPELHQLLIKRPAISLAIIDQLSSRVRTLGDMLLHVTCDDAHSRLINLLQRLADIYGDASHDEIYIDMKITHQEIADMIGVCRQTVSTMMASLKRAGIVSASRKGIAIKCPLSLGKLIEPDCPLPAEY